MQSDSLLALAMEDVTPTSDEDTPEQPEILAILRETRRFGVPYIDGPLIQYPYLLRLEMTACLDAEAEHKQALEANLRIKMGHLNGKQPILPG